jgi:tRNA (mo5U34)-methyltransferase
MINYYQSIPSLGIKGRMNTSEEFDKIGLPKDLKAKSVLDIGCNMGAFLLEAHRRGSESLVGIEPDLDWRLLAKGVLFDIIDDTSELRIEGDIDDIYGKFDLVLLLSILHVCQENPQELLDKAWSFVNEGGLLIVEINDRLQEQKVTLPEGAKFFGKNKDNRSIWHCRK